MQKATTKLNETNDNLKQICEKYKGAVQLWRKYCDESEAIRGIIDQNMGSVDDLIQNRSPEEIEVTRALLTTQLEPFSQNNSNLCSKLFLLRETSKTF